MSLTKITGDVISTSSQIILDSVNISDDSTFSGIVTHTAPLFGTQASFTGVVTASSFSGNITGNANYANTAGISTSVIGGIGSITQLQVTGISTFTNGPVLVGSGTSTGTASQPLQVTGGGYVSGNLGIGTTNPTSKLSVVGNANFIGVVTATSFSGDGSQLTGISIGDLYELDSISPAGGENTYTPTFNYETVSVTDPFKLLITVNGIIQSTYVHNTEYVHNNYLLASKTGYTIDYDGKIKFTEALPEGSEVVIKTTTGTTKSTTRRYPFNALDILF
jgi:hypothetical protein